MAPTAVVSSGFQALSTWSWKITPIPGTSTHHTASEPRVMMKAYFRPMIYPRPNTAAPVLTLNTSFALSASVSPSPMTRVVNISFHHPKVATMKS